MASLSEQGITVGSGKVIGSVGVDSSQIRAEGGPVRPQLLVPLAIRVDPRPEATSLALTAIRATLKATRQDAFFEELCRPVTESLTQGFPARSLPSGPNVSTHHLRFAFSPEEVAAMELRRHANGGDVYQLYLDLDVSVAAIEVANGLNQAGAIGESPFDLAFGMHARLSPFWHTSVSQLSVAVEQSTWVRAVLPGLGYDRLRLVELTFPPPLPQHGSAAVQFDRARRAFDERRYGDCISECRGLLNMWEKQLRVTKQARVADIVASDRKWLAGDIRRTLLDTLWKGVGDIANAPHHPEGDMSAELFGAADARLVLLLTTALSEFVATN